MKQQMFIIDTRTDCDTTNIYHLYRTLIQQIFSIGTGPVCDKTYLPFIMDQIVIQQIGTIDTGPDCDPTDIYL